MANQKSTPPSIFDFSDYRSYIARFLKETGTSYEQFCVRAGLSNKGRLGNLLALRERIHEAAIPQFAVALKLDASSTEYEYFRLMVRKDLLSWDLKKAQSARAQLDERMTVRKTARERNRKKALENSVLALREEISSVEGRMVAMGALARAQPVDDLVASALSRWYLPALAEYARCRQFEEDPDQIVAAFGGAIDRAQVVDGLDLLRRIGVVTGEKGERPDVLSLPRVTRPNEPKLSLTDYYLGIHAQSQVALGAYLRSESAALKSLTRFGALTIALPDGAVADVKDLVLEFHRGLHLILESHREKPLDRVFELYIHLFPVTWLEGEQVPKRS